jgi:spore coat protein CotH
VIKVVVVSIERRVLAAYSLRAAILLAAGTVGCAPTPDAAYPLPPWLAAPDASASAGAGSAAGAGGAAGPAGAAGDVSAPDAATSPTAGATAPPETPDAATVVPAGPTTVVAEPADEAAYIYDPAQLRTYELLLTEADLATLDADPAAEQYVPGMMRFEGRDYGPLGIRYKGSVGAFLRCVESGGTGYMPSGAKTCRKLSMKVGFDFVDPEGRFYGLRKLQFHAMTNDNSLMRERLGYGLFRAAGLPSPRAVHARLLVNGRLEGIFVLVEQIDGRFTRSRFSDGGEGNLYKEVWPMHEAEQTYITALETNEDQNPSGAKMLAFAQALAAAEGDALGDVVDTYLDRDAITKYLAVDRAIAHIDGPLAFYCNAPAGQGNNPGEIGNHNYYWYEESAAARFWIVPWDLDFAFNGFGGFGGQTGAWYEPVAEMMCGCPESGGQGGGASLRRLPSGCDKLVQGLALLREPFEARMREFAEGPFRAQAVDAQLDAWAQQIAGLVDEQAQDPEQISVEEWESALSNLRSALGSLQTAAAQ